MKFEYNKPPPGMLMVYDGFIEFIVSTAFNSFNEYTLSFCSEDGLKLRTYLVSVDMSIRKKSAIMKYPLAFYEK